MKASLLHFGRGRLAATTLLVLALSAAPSLGQDQWRQTAQVIVPVEEGLVTRALLDSAVSMIESQDVSIQQAPQASSSSLGEIEKALSEEGLATSSATHVFVTYQFSLSSGTFSQELRDLHFIFRPEGEEEDIPILYLDLQDEQFREELLVERGTRPASNEAAFVPFRQQVRFHGLQDHLTVVRVGGQIIRDSGRAAAEKKRILKVVRNLAYS